MCGLGHVYKPIQYNKTPVPCDQNCQKLLVIIECTKNDFFKSLSTIILFQPTNISHHTVAVASRGSSDVIVETGTRIKRSDIDFESFSSDSKRRKTEKVGKGLRHFSMKVCEKVQAKGSTSYNEVADELVNLFLVRI